MSNMYIETIREGLLANDNRPKPLLWAQKAIDSLVGSDGAGRSCALSITHRLKALRLVDEESHKTMVAEVVARARVGRLLNRHSATSIATLPDGFVTDRIGRFTVHEVSWTIAGGYFQRIPYKCCDNDNIESYRYLVDAIDNLSRRFSPKLCEIITHHVIKIISF